MTQSLLWWVSLLVLLVGLVIWLHNGLLLGLMHWKLNKPAYDWSLLRSKLAKKTGWILAQSSIVVLSVVCGLAIRDLWQFHHTYVLNDLTVLHKLSDSEWVMMFNDNHDKFTTRFCSDYLPKFQEGTVLKVLVYEDRGDCWSISNKKLGYIIARKEIT